MFRELVPVIGRIVVGDSTPAVRIHRRGVVVESFKSQQGVESSVEQHHIPLPVLDWLPKGIFRLQPPLDHRDADVAELAAVLRRADIQRVVIHHDVFRVVGAELGVGGNGRRVEIRIDVLLPVSLNRRSLISAHRTDHLADRALVVDMRSDGERDPSVVFGDILAPVQLLFYLVVLRQVFDDAHLSRLLGLDEAFAVAPRHLGKGLLGDDAQIIRIVQKSSVHSYVLSS